MRPVLRYATETIADAVKTNIRNGRNADLS